MKSLPFAIRQVWGSHWRLIVNVVALITVFIWGLAAGQALMADRLEEHIEGVWRVKLLGRCYLNYHTSIQAVALACPGVDYIRLWPLPPEQPWQETPDPMPVPGPGWYAKRVRAIFFSN